MNFQHIKNAYAQNIDMKTYEWIIKIISYIVCCAAVCAGFALKERKAYETLESYIKSAEENDDSKLCEILIRLKNALSRCVSGDADGDAYAEVVYCCKAATDAVCKADGGKNSEALRAFFNRVKNVCGEIMKNGDSVTLLQRQPLSELYMRLSALEDTVLSGRMSAAELINALSSGLPKEKETLSTNKLDRISVNRAQKYAYVLVGDGVRLRSRGIFDNNFIFASDRSCMILTNKGEPYIKSRTVTEGAEHIDLQSAAKTAENYITELTGKPCKAEFNDKLFGIYYFTVVCDQKEYPVGIDKTDGSIVFYVISQ